MDAAPSPGPTSPGIRFRRQAARLAYLLGDQTIVTPIDESGQSAGFSVGPLVGLTARRCGADQALMRRTTAIMTSEALITTMTWPWP